MYQYPLILRHIFQQQNKNEKMRTKERSLVIFLLGTHPCHHIYFSGQDILLKMPNFIHNWAEFFFNLFYPQVSHTIQRTERMTLYVEFQILIHFIIWYGCKSYKPLSLGFDFHSLAIPLLTLMPFSRDLSDFHPSWLRCFFL